jgi:hypothetical protein
VIIRRDQGQDQGKGRAIEERGADQMEKVEGLHHHHRGEAGDIRRIENLDIDQDLTQRIDMEVEIKAVSNRL